MEFRLTISSEDDDCATDGPGALAFILHGLTHDVERQRYNFKSGDTVPLFDRNGNKVGHAHFVEI